MSTGRPERLILDRISTAIGEALIVTDQAGVLRAFNWAEFEPAMRRSLQRHYGEVAIAAGPGATQVRRAFEAYFAGELAAVEDLPWATGGTDFQRTVWATLRTIPAGETLSYSGLAARIGKPAAVRAVGLANGQNPISVMLPCHRVIGAAGDLTGYGGGVHRKRWLLRHEGAAFRDAASGATARRKPATPAHR